MPIYRKGEDQMGLQKAALEDRINEVNAMRGMTGEEYREHKYHSGQTGAERVVYAGPRQGVGHTGPVSGAHLAKVQKSVSSAKKTKEREMKRR